MSTVRTPPDGTALLAPRQVLGAPLAAVGEHLHHDLDPQKDEGDGGAHHAHCEGREVRHLLDRVPRDGRTTEPDHDHRTDDPEEDLPFASHAPSVDD